MSKKKPIITNAMRMLQAAKISFEAIEYEVPEEISDNFGVLISEQTGLDANCTFKTLVARGDKTGILAVCIPVAHEVDLKKLARASDNKRVELIHVKELLALTGYVRGSVSPVGMKKKYPTFFDESCLPLKEIAISAGICGCTLLITPADIIAATQAQTADLCM